jgi:mono/diheme cytochrome c family protein
MMARLCFRSLSVLLCLGLVACLGGWKAAAAAGPASGQFNQEGAWGSGGGVRPGPGSQKKGGMINESIGPMCQMGGMMGGRGPGYCGPGGGAGGRQGTSGQPLGGAGLFSENCAGCHAGGGNTIMPDLPLRGSSQLQNFKTFRVYIRYPTLPNGARGAMPGFPPSRISDRQMRDLYQYLKSRWGS